MGIERVVIASLGLVCLPSCVLIDQLIEEDKCGGNEKTTHSMEFTLPAALVTSGNFYAGTYDDSRVFRWSVDHTDVCSEEHVGIVYQAIINPDYGGLVEGTGDASPFPLFGDEVVLTGSGSVLEGTLDLGLKQHWEDQAGQFSAGVELRVPLVFTDDEVRSAIDGARIGATYRASPL